MNTRDKLLSGLVIPAHPLALTAERKLDERRHRRWGTHDAIRYKRSEVRAAPPGAGTCHGRNRRPERREDRRSLRKTATGIERGRTGRQFGLRRRASESG